ncbi:hypothetical protein [Paenibacillus albidus]|nr:hypothetical protein [Paenibacillus albidus]
MSNIITYFNCGKTGRGYPSESVLNNWLLFLKGADTLKQFA